MKIPQEIRSAYEQEKVRYIRLRDEVRGFLGPKVEEFGWFYRGRVKDLESFALKVETGRVEEPSNMEDFFGCTIVVPNAAKILAAEQLVLEWYNFAYRRPRFDDTTHKASHSFEFDDLRLYVRQREIFSGRNEDLKDLLFEVQIKTFLQHAWSVATHDLIYKGDVVSWPLERIAYQVKAMLEHAEFTIAEAQSFSESATLNKADRRTTDLRLIMDVVKEIWGEEQLPKDVRRLCENIYGLLRCVDLDASHFRDIVCAEQTRLALIPLNLSPYYFTLQALLHSTTIDFESKFKRGHVKTRIPLCSDLDIPDNFDAKHERILHF